MPKKNFPNLYDNCLNKSKVMSITTKICFYHGSLEICKKKSQTDSKNGHK